jgi:hypothetical protein
MGLIERKGTAADGVGSTFDVECDAEPCDAWRPVEQRELAMGPTFWPRDDWHRADDGRTYCPEHTPAC